VTDCMAATSSASFSANGGSSPGNRLANSVFPVPGGPLNNRLYIDTKHSGTARKPPRNPCKKYGISLLYGASLVWGAAFPGLLFSKGLIAIQFEVYRTTNA